MKKIIIFAIIMSVVPLHAFADVLCKPGKYKGKIWSVSKDIDGCEASLEVKNINGKCVMNMQAEGINESWEIDGDSLYQKEINYLGEISHQYRATFKDGKYIINCENRKRNKCDDGVDHRSFWILSAEPDRIIYTVYGVGNNNKDNYRAVAKKRHEFTFRRNHD